MGAAAPVRLQKRGNSRVSAALLEPRAQRFLLRVVYCRVSAAFLEPRTRRFLPRAVPSVPYQLQVPISGFEPLILTNQLSKVTDYIIGL